MQIIEVEMTEHPAIANNDIEVNCLDGVRSKEPLVSESQPVFVFTADDDGMGGCIREQKNIDAVVLVILNSSAYHVPKDRVHIV